MTTTRQLLATLLGLTLAGCATDFDDVDQLSSDTTTTDTTPPPAVPGSIALEAPATVQWSRTTGSPGYDVAAGIATDGAGNSYVAGYFSGTINLGCGALIASGYDMFVARLDGAGACVWAKHVAATGAVSAMGLVIGPDGNLYVTGGFDGTANFGGGDLVSTGLYDLFVASYTATGSFRWAKAHGGSADEYAFGIAADATRVVVSGVFYGTTNLGGSALVSKGDADAFVAAYAVADGAPLWSKAFGDTSYDAGGAVAISTNTGVVATGTFSGAIDFGGGTVTSAGGDDGWMARFDSAGTHLSSRAVGGPGFDGISDVAISPATGHIVVVGYIGANATAGGATLTAVGYYTGVVADYLADGSHAWSIAVGGTGHLWLASVAVDSVGDIVVGGQLNGTAATLGGLASVTNGDMLVAKLLGTTGEHLFSRRYGVSGTADASAVAVRSTDDIVAVGYFDAQIDFGGGVATSAGGWDLALVALAK